MTTAAMHFMANSNDRAEILTLMLSRHLAAQKAMAVESREVTIRLGGDFAFSDAVVWLARTKPGSEGPARIWMRETMCFERRAEGWRIVGENTSAPLPVDGGMVRESMTGSKLRVGWVVGHPGFEPCGERASA
jgi:SnoaL-like domain